MAGGSKVTSRCTVRRGKFREVLEVIVETLGVSLAPTRMLAPSKML